MRGLPLINSVEEDVSLRTARRGVMPPLFVICIDLCTSIGHGLRFVACTCHDLRRFFGVIFLYVNDGCQARFGFFFLLVIGGRGDFHGLVRLGAFYW